MTQARDGRFLASILFLVLLDIGSLGCGSSDSGGSGGRGGTGGEGGAGGAGGVPTSMLRVVHLAARAPVLGAAQLDFAVVDQGSFNGIAFGRASQWAILPSGLHRLDVTEPGSEEALATLTSELEADARYTVVAYRDASQSNSIGLLLFDYVSQDPVLDRGQVRIAHAADDPTWMTMAVVDADANVVLASGLVLGSRSDPLDLPAGTYQLGFSVSSLPPAIDHGPFPIEVTAGERLFLIVVDRDPVEGSVDLAVYVLGPDTAGMIPTIPLE